MSIWDVELDKLRSSRLLALRMHVARYVVRTGATQPTAVALVDPATLTDHGDQLRELLEAAGAASPAVAVAGASGLRPTADVVLVGERGVAVSDLARRLRASPPTAAGQLWAIDVDRFARPPAAGIVDEVEWLIRIIIPAALGANGTPPPDDVALRVR